MKSWHSPLRARVSPHPALAIDWNFYHHQSAPLFATSRGAKMLSEQIEKIPTAN